MCSGVAILSALKRRISSRRSALKWITSDSTTRTIAAATVRMIRLFLDRRRATCFDEANQRQLCTEELRFVPFLFLSVMADRQFLVRNLKMPKALNLLSPIIALGESKPTTARGWEIS